MSGTSSASAALEGIRDCGDIESKPWVHFIETSDDILEYKGDTWFVFAAVGLKPSCAFARRWVKKGVREAVAPASQEYRRRVTGRNSPSGWRCFVSDSPDPVLSSGGLLECLRYKNRKVIGAFSAGPNFDDQTGPF